ncbi:MAG TPA: hypothetical protein VMY42_28320 [Thermoguttaceae bacterium]|nr:hypothetical protein [Thermoguttaceae bacterium]HUU69502.1 hypothetical protein [Planctomycetota bacterium]
MGRALLWMLEGKQEDLDAADAGQTNPPRTSYRISGPGQIELTVDNAHTVLAVPEWFTLQR